MRIYRVERPDTLEGPFTGHSREEFERVGHMKYQACWYDGPNPQGEALHEGTYTFGMGDRVCGVESVNLLRTWFPEPEALALLGYVLTVWEVTRSDDHVDAFTYQVVFDRKRATLVATHPITDTWNGVS